MSSDEGSPLSELHQDYDRSGQGLLHRLREQGAAAHTGTDEHGKPQVHSSADRSLCIIRAACASVHMECSRCPGALVPICTWCLGMDKTTSAVP